jgi:hypothetical protein
MIGLAQHGLNPREIPVPGIKTAIGVLPGVKQLLVRKELPDPLVGQRENSSSESG